MRHRPASHSIAAAGAAVLSAVLASAVYRSSVFSEFTPVRIDVVAEELAASRHLIAIALPDLSALEGHTAILDVRLRNRDAEPKRIGLLRDGIPAHRVVVGPSRTIQWQIVLPAAAVRSLQSTNDARTLELTADADVWSVMTFEIRNYHARAGRSPLAVIVPVSADRYTPAVGSTAAAAALCVLALLNALISPPQRRSVRAAISAGVVLALLTCFMCLILPEISPYKVLLSPVAFAAIGAGLYSRVLLCPFFAPKRLAGTMRSIAVVVSRTRKRREVTLERGAALFALVAIAVAQPIFEVVSNSPEFFPARSTAPANVIGAVLALCAGLPVLLIAIERTLRAANPPSAAAFHGALVALLSGALVMPWLRRAEFLGWPSVAAGVVVIASGAALAYSRMTVFRQFLTALAPAALVVPALFLLDPGVRQHLLPSESAAALVTIARTPPIVVVVFDELPTNSLLAADGNIDAVRYPNFGALAREAYWFRNASTVAYDTIDAVPAIVSGRYPASDKAVPTLRFYPVNLFTALARHYDIFASMRFQQLCPPRACAQNSAIPADTLRALLSDLGLVWLHVVLPRELTEELPPVVGEWAEFVPGGAAPAAGTSGRRGVFARFTSAIDDRPARLYFIHLVLPHMQFEYVPSGRRYRGPDYQATTYRGRGLFERASAAYADTLHQRHLAQVGFVDHLVGDLVGRLRETGAYDDALLIVTADHGASYRPGRSRRRPQPEPQNLSDILQVPLLVKLPDQRHGQIVDRVVETVDILPTILDVVGAGGTLRLDGRSLIDDRALERSSDAFFLRDNPGAAPRDVGDLSADRVESLQMKAQRFGSGGQMAWYAPPELRHLLGVRPDRTAMQRARDVQIRIGNPSQFNEVQLARDPLPLYVRGALGTSRSDPLDVVVVVNGTVAAIARSYQERGGHVFGTLIPETALREGRNTVDAFVLDDRRALSPAGR